MILSMGYKCLYHTADFDGKCSAAIVKYKYQNCELFPVDYYNIIRLEANNQFIKTSNKSNYPIDIFFDKNDIIIMSDFSFSDFEIMRFIQSNTEKFIWLDHHYTSINNSLKNNFKTDGLLNENKSGCSLTWEYFFTEREIPYSIFLLEKYDIGKFYFNNDVLPFEYGMRSKDDSETDPNNIEFWTKIFEDKEFIQSIIEEGKICLKYQNKLNKRLSKNIFNTYLEGWKCAAINSPKMSSLFFDCLSNKEEYDIFANFSLNNEGWAISLYTEKDYINVGLIAEKFGGGGHKKAAGFNYPTLPFKILKGI